MSRAVAPPDWISRTKRETAFFAGGASAATRRVHSRLAAIPADASNLRRCAELELDAFVDIALHAVPLGEALFVHALLGRV